MNWAMISCQHASELMSQQLDRPLTFHEKLRLHTHLMICRSCSRTREKFDILHQAGQHYQAQDENKPGLSKKAKQRILDKIRERDTKS